MIKRKIKIMRLILAGFVIGLCIIGLMNMSGCKVKAQVQARMNSLDEPVLINEKVDSGSSDDDSGMSMDDVILIQSLNLIQ